MSDVPDESLLTWVLGGVAVVISTLASVIGLLWRAGEARNARDISELKTQVGTLVVKLEETEDSRIECEKHRATLQANCEHLTSRVCSLEKLLTPRSA